MNVAPPGDPLDAGLRLAAALAAHGVSYALGGALAYGLWGIPRATVDVDINVFVREESMDGLFAALRSLGIEVDADAARQDSANTGLIIARWADYRIDLFTPSIDFSWAAERTAVERSIDGRVARFLSAEAIAVFKLLFFRGKDVVDLERLVAVQGPGLDCDYVRRHIVEMMGEDDERVRRWDTIVAAFGSPH